MHDDNEETRYSDKKRMMELELSMACRRGDADLARDQTKAMFQFDLDKKRAEFEFELDCKRTEHTIKMLGLATRELAPAVAAFVQAMRKLPKAKVAHKHKKVVR